jgi:uncharacterized lipoprotein YddW (UPF0748 family)
MHRLLLHLFPAPALERTLPVAFSRKYQIAMRLALCLLGAVWASTPAPARELAYLAPAPKQSKDETAREKLARAASYRRIIWVTRWDYKTADDIKKICYNAASARFTDVLFQVRGEGTVFYRSKLEPWAWELTSSSPDSTGRDPGWDPLATAVREGHRWGLRVHAYMNVLPGWAQKSDPPEDSNQLYAAHKNWFMVSKGGYRMNPANWYAFLDPGLPEVRAHLAKVFAEVTRNYKIDGIHLDYIRYPEEQGDYSYHPRVVAAFKEATGKTPGRDPEAWCKYRKKQVTAAVRAISEAVHAEKPEMEISAAVIADASRRENECLQPAMDWVRLGLVDYLAPMAYTSDSDRFNTYCDGFGDKTLRKHVWMGIIADPEKNTSLKTQIARAAARGFGGVAVFSYENLFSDHKPLARARGVYETFVSSK